MFERSGIMKKKKSRKNFSLFFIGFSICIFVVLSSRVTAAKYTETKKIVVSENDTLWNIAVDICDKNQNLSVYRVINDIKKLNKLNSSIIYPNDILIIYNY